MLILAATPIGNLQDASARLRQTLQTADVIAAEDTRVTRQLLQLLGVETEAKLIALHEHNERAKAAGLAAEAINNTVVLVSDAGMPAVSDPGYCVVSEAIQAGVEVIVVPGPSAVLAALTISGLPTDRFAFEGFIPRKLAQQQRTFMSLKDDERTLVFFESPKRLQQSLEVMSGIFGADRKAAVCRELTKKHEEVLRGSLAELVAATAGELRGEIVLVVAGAKKQAMNPAAALSLVLERVATGERLKDATRAVSAVTGVGARDLYELAHTHQKHL